MSKGEREASATLMEDVNHISQNLIPELDYEIAKLENRLADMGKTEPRKYTQECLTNARARRADCLKLAWHLEDLVHEREGTTYLAYVDSSGMVHLFDFKLRSVGGLVRAEKGQGRLAWYPDWHLRRLFARTNYEFDSPEDVLDSFGIKWSWIGGFSVG